MGFAPAIAVINSNDTRTAVWHVDVGPGMPQMSRLCGAWVTDNEAIHPQVLTGRIVFAFGDRVPGHVEPLLKTVLGVIDIPATYDNIIEWVAKLNSIHAASRTEKGNQRAPIAWRQLPDRLNWDALPSPLRGVVDDKLIANTIVAASWLGDLAEAWAAIETSRLSRSHLHGGDIKPQPLPLALKKEVSA